MSIDDEIRQIFRNEDYADELERALIARLLTAATKAVDVLEEIMTSAPDDTLRVGAATTLIDLVIHDTEEPS